MQVSASSNNHVRKKALPSFEQSWTLIEQSCKRLASRVSTLAEEVYRLGILSEEIERLCVAENEKTKCRQLVEKFDETLALMARNLTTFIHIRADKTRSTELLGHVYGETLGNLERFASVWRRFIISDQDANSSDSPGFGLLTALTEAVRQFERECEQRPQLFRYWAQEQPYLPMLVFRNKAAYRKRFARLADTLELGRRCPINVSPRANYSLETPINAKVFAVLMDFLVARDWIAFARNGDPKSAWRKGATLADQLVEQAGLRLELQPVYFAACELPPLTKATAPRWADGYVMPYFDADKIDYLNAPEFQTIRRRKRVKSFGTARAEVRKDVIRALRGMARPDVPNHPHS